jgi:hypothetical protein
VLGEMTISSILRFVKLQRRKLKPFKDELEKWMTYNSTDLKSIKQYFIALSIFVIAILLFENLEKFTIYKFLIFEPLDRKTQIILLPIIMGLIFVSVKKFKVNISPLNLSVLIFLGCFEVIQDRYQYLTFQYIINIDIFGFYIVTISLLFIKSIFFHLRGLNLSKNFNRTKRLNIIEIDGPVENLKQNKFPEREEFVKGLYESIINFDLETSISIGIEGKYGSGKTSILNILKNDFLSKRADIELINFNPWQFDNLSGVKESYLEILNERLAIDNNLLIRYKKSLSNLENKILGVSTLTELIRVNSSNAIKNQIDRKISSHPIKRKFIVFIDDLDRLDSKEIINIFKLIRVIADFKNFIYVIPYDSDYLFKSLKKELKLENREEFEFYISKIINMQREVQCTTGRDFY